MPKSFFRNFKGEFMIAFIKKTGKPLSF